MFKFKRGLAFLLCLAMLFSTASAEVLATTATEQEDETTVEILAEDSLEVYDATTGTKPSDGTTTAQPFSSGTGGSSNFRIPAIVTLDNGTLVAACDARWNTTYDGYGLDTIVSYSTNSGSTWNYTFANYLGDNGNSYNTSSTAFIDPALATDGETVWMLVDLYPGGTYIGNVNAGTGYDENGHLKLSTVGSSSSSTYDYYLGDFGDDGYAYIYSYSTDIAVTGYTVDEYFNLYYNGSLTSNLFYSDSPYKVLKTSYLYLTSSTDGGKTWSAPTMLNSQVKNSSDYFYGVGPGNAIVTSTGRIIFACYTYSNGSDGYTSVIYSDDGGKTWTRSANMSAQSSEATIVEANGSLYMFTRHGGYYVSTDDGTTWSSKKTVSGISYNTSCELSAIVYSQKIDGKTAILLSAPGNTSSRTNGKIFVGLVQDDGSISWAYTYTVTASGSSYAYSSLTELQDGSIGLLYESASAAITYTNLSISTIASGATIGEEEEEDTTESSTEKSATTTAETVAVTLYVGETYTITDESGNYASTYSGSDLNTSIATAAVSGQSIEASTTYSLGSVVSISSTGTGVISNGSGNYLVLGSNGTLSNTTDITEATVWTVTKSNSSYTIQSNGYYLVLTSSGTIIKTYTLTTSTSSSTWSYSSSNGFYTSSRYIVCSSGTWTVSTSSSNAGNLYAVDTEVVEASATTTITFTGVSAGTTSTTVGSTTYLVTVLDNPDTIYATAENGVFLSGTGNYSGSAVSKLTISVGISYDLNLGTDIATGGTWSSSSTGIATVDQNGTVTGVATGECEVYYTVNGQTYAITVTVVPTYGGTTCTCDFYITEITNTTVAYVITYNSTPVTEEYTAVEGEAIYLYFVYPFGVNFYGNADDGYALTYMASTNSAGNYYYIYPVDDVTTLAAYTAGAIKSHAAVSTAWTTSVKSQLETKINEGYDGTMGWTRGSSNSNIYSNLTFRSQKLPTVEKVITKIGSEDYVEGMTASVGDVITYEITITQYATTEAITYSDVTLTEQLTGAEFNSYNSTVVSPSLSSSTLSADTTYTYTATYTITQDDLDTTITNTVAFSYSYSSTYGNGTLSSSANAEAKITAPTFTPTDLVIDFGLPVTVDYSASNAHGKYDLESGTANYGTVSVMDNQVTYTPTSTLLTADTVTLTNTAGGTYTFQVYPATTVYYDGSFGTATGTWTTTYGEAASQELDQYTNDDSVTRNGSHNYGYDAAYDGFAYTSRTTTTAGSSVTFSFTGTGVDVYADVSTSSGTVYVVLQNENTGKYVGIYAVDTRVTSGTTSATTAQSFTTGYGVPIVSVGDLDYGTYQVTVRATDSSGFTFSGYRVYNTIQSTTAGTTAYSYYAAAGEENPTFQEIRDVVLASANVSTTNSQYSSATYRIANDGKITVVDASGLLEQVYSESTTGGVILSSADKDTSYTEEELADLLDNGPKNEVYLYPGMTLVLKLASNGAAFEDSQLRDLQISMRSLTGENLSVTGLKTRSYVYSSLDMFYQVSATQSSDGYIITITNNSTSGILALSQIKAADSVIVGTLTEEDLMQAVEIVYGEARQQLQIVTDPASVTAVQGSTATFAVEAVGDGLTYQWQFQTATGSKWYACTNGTEKSLSISATAARNGYKYRVVVTDQYGDTLTSEVATLTVVEEVEVAVGIVTQPVSVTAEQGETASFTVVTSGDGLTYQWQYKTATGTKWYSSTGDTATAATFQIAATAARSGYSYRCKITDSEGNVFYTDVVTLTVK